MTTRLGEEGGKKKKKTLALACLIRAKASLEGRGKRAGDQTFHRGPRGSPRSWLPNAKVITNEEEKGEENKDRSFYALILFVHK